MVHIPCLLPLAALNWGLGEEEQPSCGVIYTHGQKLEPRGLCLLGEGHTVLLGNCFPFNYSALALHGVWAL